jgi:predicted nucleic acid-binding protein
MSLYSPDVHSARAAAQMRRLQEPVLLTPLGEAELTNALELRIFRKEATATEIRKAQSNFREHVMGGVFALEEMPATVYERTKQIARKRTASLGLRTLGILHVASALLLRADRFWTFDRRQSTLAKAEGIPTN